MLDDASMENIRELIGKQDTALVQQAKEHEAGHAGHKVTVYNNFIQCNHCDFHVHASGVSIVQHTATQVVRVTVLN